MTVNYKNFIYNHDRGFVFAYVPKVACTNWKSLLRYMAGYDDWLNNRLAHDKINGGLRYLDLSGPDLEILHDPKIKKYTMVRDPATRVLSAYLNKVESRLDRLDASEPIDYFDKVARAIDVYRRDVLGHDAYPNITFEVFLRWIVNEAGIKDGKGHMRADEHWAPQTDLLRWGSVDFDIVARFEDLPESASPILDAMGCDIPFPTQADVKFKGTGADKKLTEHSTNDTRNLIELLYGRDIESLGFLCGLAVRASSL